MRLSKIKVWSRRWTGNAYFVLIQYFSLSDWQLFEYLNFRMISHETDPDIDLPMEEGTAEATLTLKSIEHCVIFS